VSDQSRLKQAMVPVLIALVTALTSFAARAAPQDGYDPNELSYGIYWFSSGSDYQKFDPGGNNPYFDPTHPTLIFVHGWQPTLSDTAPNFMYESTDTVAGWIADDWNVGIFFWNQFSDETVVTDAEAKIWTPDGPQGMRWRDQDNPLLYSAAPSGTPSAAELFYQAYVEALEGYTGAIRIAGHSLGNQMAVRLTQLVNDGIAAGEVSEHLRPARVALLDPYWSPGVKSYLGGQTTGDAIRESVAELLPTGTLLEWYWSSNLTVEPEGDSNDDLKPMVMYAAMDPAYESDDMDKHLAAQHLYFWSYAFDGTSACAGDACLGMTRLLSKMSDAQLAAVMRSDYRWAQNGGQDTATPADDTYQSAQQPDAPYEVTQLQAQPLTQRVGGVITVTATVTDADGLSNDGVLVTFGADLGVISARAATSGGVAPAHITSDVAGTAHISATTRGAGGVVQQTVTVTFTQAVSECVPITGAAIRGPAGVTGTLYINSSYTFDAVITPTSASFPVTYTWSPAPTNGQNHPSAAYRWTEPDTYTVTLEAENCGGPVEAAPRVLVIAERQEYLIYLPLLLRNY